MAVLDLVFDSDANSALKLSQGFTAFSDSLDEV